MTDWIVENRPRKPASDQPSLKELGTAVAEAAGVTTGLWLSYLLALFYLLIAAAGVKHKDIFLESGITLPFLSIKLPLLGFIVLGPAILLIVHAYLLLHFVLFADKARSFVRRKRAEPGGDATQELLPVNFVLQMVAAPADWSGPAELVATVIVWITLVFYPVLILAFFELQFLPFHSEWVTWWQRAAVVLDLLLLWWLWPKVTCVNQIEKGRTLRRWFERGALGLWSLAACYLVFLVATWAGERWESLPFFPFPLHETLVAGPIDDEQLRPSSPWSNRLVLAGVDLLDHAKYDSLAKLATAPALYSFRGRHLEGAVLTEANLPRADFTAAHLEGASFIRARAQGAWFDRSELEGADFLGAQLQGASFYMAHMPATSLLNASMQGATMASADLEGAWLEGADLTAASLGGSNLRYAVFDGADLRGASLDDVRLQWASLQKVKLEGAWLDAAYIWRTDFRDALFGASGLRVGSLSALPGGPPCSDGCERVEQPEFIRAMAVRYADEYTRTHLLTWLHPDYGLSPRREWTPETAGVNRLQSVQLVENENALSDLWGRMICFGNGAPFIVETLIATAGESHWSRPHYREGMVRLINHLLLDKDCAAAPAVTDTTKIQVLDLPLMREPEPLTRTAGGVQ